MEDNSPIAAHADEARRARTRIHRPGHDRPHGRAHPRMSTILLVLVGGTAGTAAREALTAFDTGSEIPWATLGINVAGAFLLGVLVESLAHYDSEDRRRAWRAILGTGFLGGFTTYSALAVASAELLGDGRVATGIGYGLGTLLAGVIAAALGVGLAATFRRARVRTRAHARVRGH